MRAYIPSLHCDECRSAQLPRGPGKLEWSSGVRSPCSSSRSPSTGFVEVSLNRNCRVEFHVIGRDGLGGRRCFVFRGHRRISRRWFAVRISNDGSADFPRRSHPEQEQAQLLAAVPAWTTEPAQWGKKLSAEKFEGRGGPIAGQGPNVRDFRQEFVLQVTASQTIEVRGREGFHPEIEMRPPEGRRAA